MTCIKCRLSSSLFFLWLTLTFQWEFNFNGSLNIGGVLEKWNFVCALNAMVRKLISLICFDICQPKWYRNALIGVPDDKTNSEKRLLWQTLHVWLKNVVESSLVTILINASMNDNEYMKYRRGKKRRNSLNWLCFTARRSEDSSTQRLHHVMVSRQSSHSMTSCPQQIAVPFAVCIFGGFGEIAFMSRHKQARRFATTSKYFA